MSVYTKLMQARIQLLGKVIKKTGENTFAKYNYLELGDFLIPAQQIFNELSLCGIVSFTADIASLTIVDMETDQQIVITSPMGSAALKGCHEVQNIGAVETYQRRYLWVTALEIVEHDAIDSSDGAADQAARRTQWINDKLDAIAAATNVGALKKIMDEALAKVRENNDIEAEDRLHAASLAKVSKAKAHNKQEASLQRVADEAAYQ